MTECGRVVAVEQDGSAKVKLEPGAHCGSCKACSAAGEYAVLPAGNRPGAVAGERVELRISAGLRINSALLVFLLPLIFFWAGYSAATAWLGAGEGGGALAGFTAVAVYGFLLAAVDRRRRSRGKFAAQIIRRLPD